MNDQQRQDLAQSLPWRYPPSETEFRLKEEISQLDRQLPLAGFRILEPGCHEGQTSVELANRGALVTAFDVRPLCVVRAFARALYHEQQVDYRIGDARSIRRFGTGYDLIFHAGVFYHLRDPIAHLREACGLATHVFLETHVALIDRPTNPGLLELTQHEGCEGRWYREQGWLDEFSGVEPQSFWVTEASLREAVRSLNLSVTEIMRRPDAVHGPRIAWLLSREE